MAVLLMLLCGAAGVCACVRGCVAACHVEAARRSALARRDRAVYGWMDGWMVVVGYLRTVSADLCEYITLAEAGEPVLGWLNRGRVELLGIDAAL